MKAIRFLFSIVFLFSQSAWAETGKPIEFGLSFKIQSDVLSEEREINVWLPKGYGQPNSDGKLKRYPVLYLIDGGADQDFQHIAALSQLSELNAAHGSMIVVGIRSQERVHELTHAPQDPRYKELLPTSGGADMFRQYILQDVIPYIEKRYDVGDKRALIGESLGGLFVVDSFLKQPDLFDDYIAVSPSLWWDDKYLGRMSKTLLTKGDYSKKRIYLAMANEGGTMQGGLDLLMGALKEMKDAPLWTYVDRSAELTHATIFHPAALHAFKWLYPLPPYVLDETPWYLIEGGQPEAAGAQ